MGVLKDKQLRDTLAKLQEQRSKQISELAHTDGIITGIQIALGEIEVKEVAVAEPDNSE